MRGSKVVSISLSAALMATMLGMTGCGNGTDDNNIRTQGLRNNNNNNNRNFDVNSLPEGSRNFSRSAGSGQDNTIRSLNYSRALSNRVAQLRDVQTAHVVVTDRDAYVAVTLHGNNNSGQGIGRGTDTGTGTGSYGMASTSAGPGFNRGTANVGGPYGADYGTRGSGDDGLGRELSGRGSRGTDVNLFGRNGIFGGGTGSGVTAGRGGDNGNGSGTDNNSGLLGQRGRGNGTVNNTAGNGNRGGNGSSNGNGLLGGFGIGNGMDDNGMYNGNMGKLRTTGTVNGNRGGFGTLSTRGAGNSGTGTAEGVSTVPSDLRNRIVNAVRQSAPNIRNVYISTDSDFVTRVGGFATQTRGANVNNNNLIDDFQTMINRVFPGRAGTMTGPNGYAPTGTGNKGALDDGVLDLNGNNDTMGNNRGLRNGAFQGSSGGVGTTR